MSLLAAIDQLARIQADRPVALDPDVPIRDFTGYRPRPLQAELRERRRRFSVEVVHRRFGKSVEGVNALIEAAPYCPFPNGRFAFLAPTYGQAEDIIWTYLKDFTEHIPGRKVQESKLSVWLPTYLGGWSRIRLYGVDSPKQRLRGLYLDGVVIDETQDIPPSVWNQQVRPMLMDKERRGVDLRGERNQWALFFGTPKGRNFLYSLYRDACIWQRGEPVYVREGDVERPVLSDEWSAALWPASKTGILEASELAAARAQMGKSKYLQELECSFDAAVEGAIYAEEIEKIRKKGQITSVPHIPGIPVNTSWDLGKDDATAIWFWQSHEGRRRYIDFYENSGIMSLDPYIDVLADKPYRYGKHYFPHDVKQDHIGMDRTRVSALQGRGVIVTVVPKHVREDRIAATRIAIPECWFDETNCADGLDKLSLYQREFDEKLMKHKDAPKHDWASHAADAFGIGVMGSRGIRALATWGAGGHQPSAQM